MTEPKRIYFPAQDDYVIVGQLPNGEFTAHLEDAPLGSEPARGRGCSMLAAIADLANQEFGLNR